jgi:hypothetical protein
MATPLQSPASRRKLIYLGLILGLFVVNTFLWRGVSVRAGAGGEPGWWTVQARANNLELTDEAQGAPDLVGSTVRLVLTGSRGLATTLLWKEAINKQMRNEWTELEFLVRTLTKLQPHFLTPWLFQSWNLSYNVSVEADRVRDKYFYISRGIELLAQGERLNKDNPDMRWWIGFYYQNKFGVSDENNSLRSLFQLSCIPPEERTPLIRTKEYYRTDKDKPGEDPAAYKAILRDSPQYVFPDGKVLDPAWFKTFCEKHPQLVRRLREPAKDLARPFRCRTPLDVAEFLQDNRGLPTRFVEAEGTAESDSLRTKLRSTFTGRAGELKPSDQQFPTLPVAKPAFYRPTDDEPTSADSPTTLGDSFDAYAAGRAWFAFAQDPLPEADPLAEITDRKERIKTLKDKRLPRQPAEVLFRQAPGRAQSYVGERLHKEGWFDDTGWIVDEGRDGRDRWFPRTQGDVVVGAGKDYATEAWQKAYDMWRDFGERNGMLFKSEPERISMEAQAKKFQERYKVGPNDMVFAFREDNLDPEMQQCLRAQRFLAVRGTNLGMTNFMHHFVRANAERERETAQARKTIDRAQRYRLLAKPQLAIAEFEKGLEQWKDVLRRTRPPVNDPQLRDDDATQEELYETEVRYLDEIQKHRGEPFRAALTFGELAGAAAASAAGVGLPAPLAPGLMYYIVKDTRALPMPIQGPLDGEYAPGKAWISIQAMGTVRQRLSQETPAAPPKTPTPDAGKPKPKG